METKVAALTLTSSTDWPMTYDLSTYTKVQPQFMVPVWFGSEGDCQQKGNGDEPIPGKTTSTPKGSAHYNEHTKI